MFDLRIEFYNYEPTVAIFAKINNKRVIKEKVS